MDWMLIPIASSDFCPSPPHSVVLQQPLPPSLPPIELAETNLAAIGSELDKKHRKEEGALEKAWGKETGVGSKAGLWVWRIEQFQVVAVREEQVGQFYSGDSYIVLKVRKKG